MVAPAQPPVTVKISFHIVDAFTDKPFAGNPAAVCVLDQPATALIHDLKQLELLEDTLVVWCTEFGRMPFFQQGVKGRDHNPDGFTRWLTGAGMKAGISHGRTDDLGQKAIEDIHPLYHFKATILQWLGLDYETPSFEHNEIQRRLTNVEGQIIPELLG